MVVFTVGLTLWTWKLIEPSPVPESMLGQLRSWDELLPFLLAKSLHCCGYAFLTVVGLVWVPTRWWQVLVGFLMLHSLATEILQYVLPFNRFGRGADVAIDWIGITFGVLTYYSSFRAGLLGPSRL
jgi:hypothetical protein